MVVVYAPDAPHLLNEVVELVSKHLAAMKVYTPKNRKEPSTRSRKPKWMD
jgi:hypothetical protein